MTLARRLLVSAAAFAVSVALPGAAGAANGDSFKCAPKTSEWCVGIFHKKPAMRVFFDIGSFELRGRYRLCVTPPRRRATCKRFGLRLQAQTGSYNSSVLFTRNFPHRVRGRYQVRWSQHGRQIGPTLTFRW